MEIAMMDTLVEHAQDRGIKQIIGYFRPTAKNALVADMYDSSGFTHVAQTAEGGSIWSLNITDYSARTRHITLKPSQR